MFREPEILRAGSGLSKILGIKNLFADPFSCTCDTNASVHRQYSAPCSHSCATFYGQLHMNPYFWIRYSGTFLSWKSLLHSSPPSTKNVCMSGLNRFLYPSLNIVGAIRAATVTRVRCTPCRFSKTCSQTSAPE